MPAKSPLADSDGSLTKNIHIEKHYNLLKQITVDMPEANVRQLPGVDDGIFTTALKRYLLVDGGLVRRDRLVTLIQEERGLTERVRMAMYLLFMLRDGRCRAFVCNRLSQADGLWSDTPLQTVSPNYPEFRHSGTTKASTNIRGFLFQVGLTDESFRLKKFPPLDSWFSEAVDIISQHISDFETKQRFIESPQALLAEYGSLGLLNLAPKEIIRFQPDQVIGDTTDLLPIYDQMPGNRHFDASAFKTWNRTGPIKRSTLSKKATLANPALLERAYTQHFLLERLTAELCRKENLAVHQTILIDLLAKSGAGSILFEMKSCSTLSIRGQVRRGISQLLEYSFLYRDEITAPQLCLVLERKPTRTSTWLIDYVESLGISMLWKLDRDDQLGCSKTSQQRLLTLISCMQDWVCE